MRQATEGADPEVGKGQRLIGGPLAEDFGNVNKRSQGDYACLQIVLFDLRLCRQVSYLRLPLCSGSTTSSFSKVILKCGFEWEPLRRLRFTLDSSRFSSTATEESKTHVQCCVFRRAWVDVLTLLGPSLVAF